MKGWLLDTHTVLWLASADPKLSARARLIASSPESPLYWSMAGVWEVSVKKSMGKLLMSMPVDRFVTERVLPQGIAVLPISLHHLAKVEQLPCYHADPFDRLIIAQALCEGFTILSADIRFDEYGVDRVW